MATVYARQAKEETDKRMDGLTNGNLPPPSARPSTEKAGSVPVTDAADRWVTFDAHTHQAGAQ